MINNLNKISFINIACFSFLLFIIIRLTAMFLIGDENLKDEWLFIIQNLSGENPAGKEMFATRVVDGEPVPNFFMPPAYPFFIYSLKLFFGNQYLTEIVLISQILISVISIFFLYKILIIYFSKRIALFSTLVYAILPINIYASIIISSSSIQLSLLIFYFYFIIKFANDSKFWNLFIFSIFASILILLRGEFFAFHFLTITFLIYKKVSIKKLLLSILITLILTSPYIIRNYSLFGSISIAKAEGYDLWKGNNPNAGVEGNETLKLDSNKILKEKIEQIPPSKDYDLIIDKLFKEQALIFIKSDPVKYIILYLKKFLTFLFINLDSNYPGYYNFFHIVPKLILSFTTVISFFYLKKKDDFLIFCALYYLATISIFSVFFILPRYSLSVLPIQLFLFSFYLDKLKLKFFRN